MRSHKPTQQSISNPRFEVMSLLHIHKVHNLYLYVSASPSDLEAWSKKVNKNSVSYELLVQLSLPPH